MSFRPQRDLTQQCRQRHEQHSTGVVTVEVGMGGTVRDRGVLFQVIPQRMRALSQSRHQFAFPFRVAQKITKATRVNVFTDAVQIVRVEFETVGILPHNLIDTIQKLQENG